MFRLSTTFIIIISVSKIYSPFEVDKNNCYSRFIEDFVNQNNKEYPEVASCFLNSFFVQKMNKRINSHSTVIKTNYYEIP